MRSKFIDLYKNYIHEIWLFIIVFFFHMMLNPLLPHISSLPTETLSKAAAAYFSGKNWESLMVGSDYYGTGFYIILTPIYCLTNHAVIIRQFTLGLVVLLNYDLLLKGRKQKICTVSFRGSFLFTCREKQHGA